MSGEDLRALMRRFPAGVAVISVDLAGERLGLTVSSLVPLSLQPPLVGVAISRQAALHELLRAAGDFGVSLLAAGQEDVAAHFARGVPPIAHWVGMPLRAADDGPPLIDGALGWLRCRISAEQPTGDHTLFVGDVLSAEPGPGSAPLVYLNGAYVAL